MTPRKDNFPHPDPPVRSPSLQVVHPHAAAVDIGAAEHGVAVPPDRDAQPVRRFGTCTIDLEAIADWLLACDVTTVAMESTGVYWIPLFEVLEARGFQAILIDPRQAQRAPGRPKSDPRDCQWLQRLHAYGLLAGAFRPDDQVGVLRAYLRQRRMLITYASQHIQPMQKALEQMNLKLPEVVSDITGVTGMTIIQAIVAGARDTVRLAQLRDRRCQHSEEQIAKALQGTWRAEHLFALRQAVNSMTSPTVNSWRATRRLRRISPRFLIRVMGTPCHPDHARASGRPMRHASRCGHRSIVWPASTSRHSKASRRRPPWSS